MCLLWGPLNRWAALAFLVPYKSGSMGVEGGMGSLDSTARGTCPGPACTSPPSAMWSRRPLRIPL